MKPWTCDVVNGPTMSCAQEVAAVEGLVELAIVREALGVGSYTVVAVGVDTAFATTVFGFGGGVVDWCGLLAVLRRRWWKVS